MDQALLSDF